MLQVVCPACGAKLNIRDDLKGKRINCGACTNSFSIASQAEQVVIPTQVVATRSQQFQAEPAGPVIRADSISYRAKYRRPSLLTRVISLAIQIGITCGTLYGGYYLLSQRVAVQKAPQPKVVQVQKPRSARPPAPKAEMQEAPRIHPRIATRSIAMPMQQVSRLPALPDQIDLPAVEDSRTTTLLEGIADAELDLVSLSPHLKHDGKKLSWHDPKESDKPIVFAGLTVKERKLLFRWLGSVPREAEGALRNSVIKLGSEGNEQTIAMRQPLIVEPFDLSLKRNVQRIVAKFEHLPPREAIRADFTGVDLFPYHQIKGCGTKGLKLKDVTTIWYKGTNAAATKVTLKKIGKSVVFELDSRYKLPSGDEEPMSISKGSRKRKQLNKLAVKANAAMRVLSDLQTRHFRLREELHDLRVHTPNTRQLGGMLLDSSLLLSRKIERVQGAISATEADMVNAKRLISQRPKFQRELAEFDRVSQLAGALHGTKGLTYRIYMLVAGREVDLLIAK